MVKKNQQAASGEESKELRVADAIRMVTTKMQDEVGTGRRSSRIDAYDLIDLLLAIADEIDPIK